MMEQHRHRFSRKQRKRVLRFAIIGNGLPLAVATATDFSSHHTVFFIGAVGALLAPIGVTVFSRERSPVGFYAAGLGGLPALTMMQAYSGGVASGYSILMMMAMIWFGIQTSDRELAAGMVILAACAYLPMLIFGPPAYPVDWGHATLLVLVGITVAMALRALTRETQQLNERLRRDATVDDLTGLLNRRGWRESAERELGRARRRGAVAQPRADRPGQPQGDQRHARARCGGRVLRDTADRMRSALRAGDVLARLGGDEFGALLVDTSEGQALAAIARLREMTPRSGSFSAGAAIWDGCETLDELLRRADVALYTAKTDGGSVDAGRPADPGAV